MARPANDQPTDGELEILGVLWKEGPCGLGQLCTAIRQVRPVATTTVATMLKIMLGKSLVRRTAGPRGAVWAARVGRDEVSQKLLGKLLDGIFDGSPQLLVSHLVDSRPLSDKDRRELLSLLSTAKSKSPKKGETK